jgi:hypothetical protein
LGDADLDGRLSRFLPSDARRGIAALSDIYQLDERIDFVGVDFGGRREFDRRVRRDREFNLRGLGWRRRRVTSPDDWNCAGVSGALGARLLVSLQAQSRANPGAAKSRSLTGGTKRIPDRRGDRRLRLRTNRVDNFANVLVQHAPPRRQGHEPITRAGQDREFWQAICDLGGSLAVAHP